MPDKSIRKLVIAGLALFTIAGLLLVESSAQKRRRKPRAKPRPSAPRIVNPAIYQPSPTENENANTPATPSVDESALPEQKPSPAEEDPDAMKKTIRTLSNQVDKLSDKIGRMEESQRSLVDLERLSRAEARNTALRAELGGTLAKEGELQSRAEDIEFSLKPENIERSVVGYGTTRPEELREQRRRQLLSEKERVQKQLDVLAANRARLETAIATSDMEVERLRKKLEAADEAEMESARRKAQSEGTSSSESLPRSRPSPTP